MKCAVYICGWCFARLAVKDEFTIDKLAIERHMAEMLALKKLIHALFRIYCCFFFLFCVPISQLFKQSYPLVFLSCTNTIFLPQLFLYLFFKNSAIVCFCFYLFTYCFVFFVASDKVHFLKCSSFAFQGQPNRQMKKYYSQQRNISD